MSLILSSELITLSKGPSSKDMSIFSDVSKSNFTPDTWNIVTVMIGKLTESLKLGTKREDSGSDAAQVESIHIDINEDEDYFIQNRFPIFKNSAQSTKKLYV